MKKITFAIFGLWLMVACQQEISVAEDSKERGAIYLSAMVENQVESKAPYQYTAPNSANADGKLYTTVLASSEKTVFKHDSNANGTGDGVVSIHTQANFDNNTPQLLKDAVYPKQGTPVYFIGLHPQTGWTVNDDGTNATIQIDGSQDVMFAPRIVGTYAQDNTSLNAQQLAFKHLLTWLKVKIKAEDDQTIAAWGKIKKMTITSKNTISVDLSKENSDLTCVSYSNDVQLPLYYVHDDSEFPGTVGYTMTTSGGEAYVLCTPVDATATTVVDGKDVETAEYILHIETEKRVLDLPIDLRKNSNTDGYFTESTRSRCFTLNLTFKMGNTIVITATLEVTDWKYGGTTDKDIDI